VDTRREETSNEASVINRASLRRAVLVATIPAIRLPGTLPKKLLLGDESFQHLLRFTHRVNRATSQLRTQLVLASFGHTCAALCVS
jgi:hypothetical protein